MPKKKTNKKITKKKKFAYRKGRIIKAVKKIKKDCKRTIGIFSDRIKANRLAKASLVLMVVAACYVGAQFNAGAAGELDVSAYITGADDSQVPNGEYEVRFALYTNNRVEPDPYPSDSDASVWEETQAVRIHNGTFNAFLGETNPLPASIDFGKNQYYLGIRIGEDAEMVPRKKIGAVPLSVTAVNALTAQNANTLMGQPVGTAAGNIPAIGTGGKIDIAILPTGTSGNTLVLSSDPRLANSGSGTVTSSTISSSDITDFTATASSITIGSNSHLSGNFYVHVSSAAAKPSLRFNSSQSTWQFSNDGTNFVNFSSGSTGDYLLLAGGTMTGAITFSSGQTFGGATLTELGYVSGVTSAIQTQLDAKAALVHVHAAGDITSGTLETARGGTGLSSYTAGDMLYYSSGTTLSKLGIGSAGQILTVSGGIPSWSASSGSNHNLLSATHPDTTIGTVARGDLITGQGASPTWSKLTIGSSGYFLKSDGTDAAWAALTKSDVGLGSVENTALSTWIGTTNITTLGTIGTGVWNGSDIDISDYTNLGVGGTMLQLSGDTLSVREGTLTDTKICTYVAGTGLVCNTDAGTNYWQRNGTDVAPATIGDNVGVGTTAPTYKLQIVTTGTDGLRVDASGSGNQVFLSGAAGGSQLLQIYRPSLTNDVYFQASQGNLALQPTSGNVGIGTTNPANAKLEVNGTVYASAFSDDGAAISADTVQANLSTALSTGLVKVTTGTGALSTATAGTDYIAGGVGAANQIAYFTGSGTLTGSNNLYFNGTNVGIGTTAPTDKLDIAGGVKIGSGYAGVGTTAPANGVLIQGNVGVGTTSPDAKLQVKSDTNLAAAFKVDALDVPGNYQKAVTIDNSGNPNSLTDYQILITLDTASLIAGGKMRSDCGDLRVRDSDQSTPLNYWLESGCNTGSTNIWVKVPSIGASSTKTVYVYYGKFSNLSLSSASSTMYIYENYQSTPSGSLLGSATYDSVNQRVQLTTPAWQTGVLQYAAVPTSPTGFYAKFYFWSGGGSGADAAWLSAYSDTYTYEDEANGGYNFTFDEFEDRIKYTKGGGGIATYTASNIDNSSWHLAEVYFWYDGSRANARIYYDSSLVVDSYDGTVQSNVANGLGKMIWGGRGAATTNYHRIGNGILSVRKYTASAPAVSVGGETETISSQLATTFFIRGDSVGIGTTNPTGLLDVGGGKISIFSNGNVGVGTTSPAGLLDVNGKFTVLSAGNVGIGTTAPASKLDISGSVRIYDQTPTTGTSLLTIKAGAGQSTNPLLQWLNNSGTELGVINASGNIGIGTSNPTMALDVISNGTSGWQPGPLRVTGNGTEVGMTLNNTGTGGRAYSIFSTSGASVLGQGRLIIADATGTAARVAIDSGGNVGIGTAAPTNLFDIAGGVKICSGYAGIGTTAPVNGLLIQGNVGIGTTVPKDKLAVYGGVKIGTGYAGIGTTAPTNGMVIEGRVGIGTTIPGNKLTVSGGVGIGTTSPSSVYLSTAAPDGGLIIEGNVGIGTTNPANAKLEVNGTVYASAFSDDGAAISADTVQANLSTALSTGLVKVTTGTGALSTATAGTDYIAGGVGAANQIAYFTGSGTLTGSNNLYFNGTNVGIGTTAPTDKLDIAGGVKIGSGYAGIGTTAPTNGMLVQGNVGIGTTAPGAKLEVNLGPTYSSLDVARFSVAANGLGQVNQLNFGVTADNKFTIETEAVSAGAGGKGSDVLPHDLTSNNSHPPFVVYVSSMTNPFDGFKALDNLISAGQYWLGTGSGVDWWKVDLGSGGGKAIYSYAIRVNDIPEPNRAPKNWTFEGSNDNSIWNVVDTVTNQTAWESGESREFTTDINDTEYRYYRVNITANNGDETYTQIAEIYLYETEYSTSVPSLVLGAGGEHVAITSGGNVGIGTTAPGNKLSVSGGVGIGTTAPGSLYLSTVAPHGGMIVEGNVGIGTTAPLMGLHVAKSVAGSGLGEGTYPAIIQETSAAGSGGFIGLQLHLNRAVVNDGIAINFAANDSAGGREGYASIGGFPSNVTNGSEAGYLSFSTRDGAATMGEKVRITTAGNVGIGTTGPGAKLHVVGSGAYWGITLDNTNTTYSAMEFKSNGTTYGYVGNALGLVSGSATDLGIRSENALFLAAGGARAVTILSGGYVGVGTTAPDQALDVVGTIQASNLLGGASNITTDANGNIIRDPSDARLKENIHPITGALDKVMGLRGVTYKWKDKKTMGTQTDYGLIAQEVFEVTPELTATSADGIMGVKYTNMVGLLVNAVQEQQGEISQSLTLGEANSRALGEAASSLDLKIAQSQSDVSGLQTAVNEKLNIISNSLTSLDSQISQTADLKTKLASAETRLTESENNLATFETATNDTIVTMLETEQMLTQKILDHEDRLKALEDKVATLSVSGGEVPANILTQDSLGNVDLKGILTAKTVKADGVVAGEIDTKGIQMNSENSGKGTIEAGQKEIEISTTVASENVKIYITPVGNTFDQVLYVDEIKKGESFKVKINKDVSEDIRFNWLIIK